MTKVSGLDLSMSGTGVAHSVFGVACTHVIVPKEKGDHRLVEIQGRIMEYIGGSELVVMEGFLNKSFSAGITGMVHGTVRAALIRAGIEYLVLPPTSLKKFATGKGGASKTDMAVAAFKRGRVEFKNDNECDAWWLWVAANEHLGNPVVEMPKAQVASLAALQKGS